MTTPLVLPAGAYGDSGIADVEPPSSHTTFGEPVGTAAGETTLASTTLVATLCTGCRRPAVGA